jgi:hypothetical protein
MVGGEDVLFRPVLHKVLAPERLLDGSVDLAFIMLLNEAIDIEQENMYRAAKARQRKE